MKTILLFLLLVFNSLIVSAETKIIGIHVLKDRSTVILDVYSTDDYFFVEYTTDWSFWFNLGGMRKTGVSNSPYFWMPNVYYVITSFPHFQDQAFFRVNGFKN